MQKYLSSYTLIFNLFSNLRAQIEYPNFTYTFATKKNFHQIEPNSKSCPLLNPVYVCNTLYASDILFVLFFAADEVAFLLLLPGFVSHNNINTSIQEKPL